VNRLLPTVFVLAVWLALWGEISVVNVASGVLVVAILAVLFRPDPRRHRLHPLALIRLLAVFVWRLVSSSATVVLTVIAPTPARLRSGVVGVPLSQPSPLVATIVADAISLTPGTLTLEARYAGDDDGESPDSRPPVLYIHVLGLSDPEAIRADVRSLERLVVSAVTPIDRDEPATVGAEQTGGGRS
jgi:multicomponent Na+:H+ antiporter subunit E